MRTRITVLIASALLPFAVAADVTFDGTVGDSAFHAPQSGAMVIDQQAGDTVGTNLFHSFGRFGIDPGESATFCASSGCGPSDISNVISRVTGIGQASLEQSVIDGTLRVDGTAGFWLVNPAGIVVGENAVFDVAGQLALGATDNVTFADGFLFNAIPVAGEDPSTFTSALPEAFGIAAGATGAAGGIDMDGGVISQEANIILTAAGDIQIVHDGDITLDNAQIETKGFNISGDVRIESENGNITLLNRSRVDTSSDGAWSGGSIFISGGDITIDGADSLVTGRFSTFDPDAPFDFFLTTLDSGDPLDAGEVDSITVFGNEILGLSEESGYLAAFDDMVGTGSPDLYARTRDEDGNVLSVNRVSPSANGFVPLLRGTIDPEGSVQFDVTGLPDRDFTGDHIQAGDYSLALQLIESPDAGNIDVRGDSIFLAGANFEANADGTGDAGSITFTADTVRVQDGGIEAIALGSGAGGDISFVGQSLVVIDGCCGDGVVSSTNTGEGGTIVFDAIRVRVEDSASVSVRAGKTGVPGNVLVQADRLTIGPESGISARGGNILVRGKSAEAAQLVNLFGDESEGGELIASNIEIIADVLDIGAGGMFAGGDIVLFANQLSMGNVQGDGTVSVRASGEGDAGTITIWAPGSTIEAPIASTSVSLENYSAITSSSEGDAGAGSITIYSRDLSLRGEYSRISAETDRGAGGAITLNVDQLLIESSEIPSTNFFDIAQISGNTLNGSASDIRIQGADSTAETRTRTQSVLIQGGVISSSSSGALDAGNIDVFADNISLTDFGQIAAETDGAGAAGNIDLRAGQINVSNRALISANTRGSGAGGNVNVLTDSLVLLDGGRIEATSSGSGNAGFINLGTPDNPIASLIIEGTADPFELPLDTGRLRFYDTTRSPDFVFSTLDNGDPLDAGEVQSLFFGSAQFGDLSEFVGDLSEFVPYVAAFDNTVGIDSLVPDLFVRRTFDDGDRSLRTTYISPSPLGDGRVPSLGGTFDPDGSLQFKVSGSDDFRFIGNHSQAGDYSINFQFLAPEFLPELASGLESSTTSSGNAGNISVFADSISVMDGAEISVATSGAGDAGNVTITGKNVQLLDGARVAATTSGSGNAGNVLIRAGHQLGDQCPGCRNRGRSQARRQPVQSRRYRQQHVLTIDASEVVSSATGTGNAGNVTLLADAGINLLNGARVATDAAASEGGDITLDTNGDLVMQSGQIVSSAGAAGSGGDINLTIGNGFLQQSRILTQADAGNGGEINIAVAPGRAFIRDSESVINADSNTGTAGDIVITSPSQAIRRARPH